MFPFDDVIMIWVFTALKSKSGRKLWYMFVFSSNNSAGKGLNAQGWYSSSLIVRTITLADLIDSWWDGEAHLSSNNCIMVANTHKCTQRNEYGPISLTFFHDNSNVMKISFWFFSHPNFYEVIVTKFCTWHDSCGIVACAKYCCDKIPAIELQLNEISIEFELWRKIVSEMGPRLRETATLTGGLQWNLQSILNRSPAILGVAGDADMLIYVIWKYISFHSETNICHGVRKFLSEI